MTDLVRRHRKSDLTIAGIGLTMNTAISRFLKTPEDAAGKDMLELMEALRRTPFAKKIGRHLADVPADTAHSLHGLLAMHTFLLDAYLEQHPDSKLRQPPMDEVQAAAHIIDRQFRAETFRELRHLTETSGRYMLLLRRATLRLGYRYGPVAGDARAAGRPGMSGRSAAGTAAPGANLEAENRMVREAERILEGDQEIPLRQTYIEKLDAELQTLGWLARFPGKKSIALISTGSCSTNTGFFPHITSRAIRAGRESFPRTGRTARTHDRTAALRRRSVRIPAAERPEAGETYFRGAAERDRFYKKRAARTIGHRLADKTMISAFRRKILKKRSIQ